MFKTIRTVSLLAAFSLAGAVHAQDSQGFNDVGNGPQVGAAANAADPPSRVARLSLVNGPVSFVPAGENDWAEAQINRPLITGDKLWADRGARAELEIGSSVIRVDEQSSFNFLNLDDDHVQVELTQGTLNLRVRRLYDNQSYEIDTPTLAFVINRVGEYRIDVSPDGNGTIVTTFHGGGDAYGEAGARFRVEEGQSIRFNDPQLRDYESNAVPSPDDFDRFCFERDGRWDNSPSRQFVSEEVIGYDDLDSNGTWNNEADYGNVWYPTTVTAGWTPYSYGHWGWVGAYGWTWIDSSPWGFAPFHYGRWAHINNRWGWCPGEQHVRPYYAPALVAFIGGGGGARVGFNAGGPVGWFPLGPRDVYVPGYRVSRDYFNRVNVYNTRIDNVTINNYYGNYSRGNFDYARVNYANRNIAGAVTAVPGNVFIGARAIRGSAVAVNRETFANARVSGFAAIAPTRDSLAFHGSRGGAMPPQAALNRNIIAATRPPAPIASFAQRETQLQRDPGRALPVNQLRVAPNQNIAGQPNNAATRGGFGGRPNVNVVTSNGQPARTPAPAILQRGRTQENNRQQMPNGVANQARPGVNAQQPQQDHLPSTRYTNPNAGNNPNSTNGGRTPLNNGRPADATPRVDNSAAQRSNNDNNRVNDTRGITQQRAPVLQQPAAVERTPQVDQSRTRESRSVTEQPQRVTPQEYRSAPVEHAAQPQRQVQPDVQREVQQQRVQPPVQQREIRQEPQQQQRVQPQVQQRVQPQVQQEYRAPAQQQFQQRVQPQPQQERVAPQPQQQRERPQRGEDKKDDKGHR
jgi:hypothetical protein